MTTKDARNFSWVDLVYLRLISPYIREGAMKEATFDMGSSLD